MPTSTVRLHRVLRAIRLKHISQIEHSRPRSLIGFMVNLVGGLIAYTFQPKKPFLGLRYGASASPS